MGSIAVGADDAGAPLKERLAAYLRDHGYEIKDFGNGDGQALVDRAVGRGESDLGFRRGTARRAATRQYTCGTKVCSSSGGRT